MRAFLLALGVSSTLGTLACGGDVVVDPSLGAASSASSSSGGGVGGAGGSDVGHGGAVTGVVCGGVICAPGQVCCSPAGPTLECVTGTSCPP